MIFSRREDLGECPAHEASDGSFGIVGQGTRQGSATYTYGGDKQAKREGLPDVRRGGHANRFLFLRVEIQAVALKA